MLYSEYHSTATMLLLKSLPIGYTASLRDIKLINFTIDAEELVSGIPQLPLVKMNNHPVISLLDVKIHRLKPSGLFTPIHFTYRHIAFRVLINDNYLHNDGILAAFFICIPLSIIYGWPVVVVFLQTLILSRHE